MGEVAIGEDLGLKSSFNLAREESIWREEHDLFGAGEGEAEHGIGKERDGRMRRRLLARIGLEDGVFFS